MLKFFLILTFAFSTSKLKSQSYYNPMGRTQHIIAGAAVAVTTYTMAELLFPKATKSETKLFAERISLISVFSAALGKEFYDYAEHKHIHTWNAATLSDGFGDFITTCLSGMTVSVLIPF